LLKPTIFAQPASLQTD